MFELTEFIHLAWNIPWSLGMMSDVFRRSEVTICGSKIDMAGQEGTQLGGGSGVGSYCPVLEPE